MCVVFAYVGCVHPCAAVGGRKGRQREVINRARLRACQQQLDIRGLASQHNPLKMLSLLQFFHFQRMYQCSFVPFVRVLGYEAFNLAGFCHRRVVMVFWMSCNGVIRVKSRCTVACNRGKGSPLLAGWVTHHLINIPQQITPAQRKTCAKPVQNHKSRVKQVQNRIRKSV